METTQDWIMAALKLLGALGLLIYGMHMMSEALQKMAGPQLRHIISRMTSNRFTGMLTGTAVTCAVQSSSATTVMTVSFVSAGLLTLSQAISVIMGANIGTTLTAWILSLGYNVDLTAVVFPCFLVGYVLIGRKRFRYAGDFLFGIAFLFMSLVLLSTTGREMDLEHNRAVMDFFGSFDTGSYLAILQFLGLGTLITCVLQSSAAVMAITILLCSTGVLPIHLGIALVMGENIGTTATANLAALSAGAEARRAALAHLVFNVIGVLWVLAVFYPFTSLVCGVAGYDMNAAGQTEKLPVVLALFHTGFNVINTALLIGFIPQLERLVRWLIPDGAGRKKKSGAHLKYIQSHLVQVPEIAVLQAQRETEYFGLRVQWMFSMVGQLLETSDSKAFAELYSDIEKEEDATDKTELEIAEYLQMVSEGHLSYSTKMKVRRMMRQISELESIGDVCFSLARTMARKRATGNVFGERQVAQLRDLMALCDSALTQMRAVAFGRRGDVDEAAEAQSGSEGLAETYRIKNEINLKYNQLKADNVAAVNNGEYDYSSGTIFVDLVRDCKRLGGYVVNVVEAREANK